MNQIISRIESSVEDQENQAEKLNEDREQILSRELEIKKSIQQLENDAAVSNILESNLLGIGKEKEEINKKIEQLSGQISNIMNQIEEVETESENSESVVAELQSLGEDIGESRNIVFERRRILEKCREKIGQIAEKLGEVLSGQGSDRQIRDGNSDAVQSKVSERNTEDRDSREQKVNEGGQKIEEFNKMIDESVRKHGEMSGNAHYMPREELNKEHQLYIENAEREKKEFAAQIREHYGESKIENRYASIKADEIKDLRVNERSFWDYKSTPKEKYFDMASKIPAVERGLQSGKSIGELREDPELKDTVDAYYDENNRIIVERDQEGYHFQDNGRHRVAAARELGIDIPVKIVDRIVR